MFSLADVRVTFREKKQDFLFLEVQKGELKLAVRVELKAGYPVIPPLWHLSLISVPACHSVIALSAEYEQLMDSSEQVEALRAQKQCLSSGEPIQPILEQIQNELHLHYHDYCNQSLDFLLTYQLKKLQVCAKILEMTLLEQGHGVYERSVGTLGQRPFWFDPARNMFSQRY